LNREGFEQTMAVKDEIHWTTTAGAAPNVEKLQSSLNVDVLVVGGGLTGCRTALGLAEKGVSVAVVEAKDIGWGASGRSGGNAIRSGARHLMLCAS
jgi:glycerol-3-phosphate dehydrogenase